MTQLRNSVLHLGWHRLCRKTFLFSIFEAVTLQHNSILLLAQWTKSFRGLWENWLHFFKRMLPKTNLEATVEASFISTTTTTDTRGESMTTLTLAFLFVFFFWRPISRTSSEHPYVRPSSNTGAHLARDYLGPTKTRVLNNHEHAQKRSKIERKSTDDATPMPSCDVNSFER